MGENKLSRTLRPWAAEIAAFDLEVERVKGKDNMADIWTRPPFMEVDPAMLLIAQQNPLLRNPDWKKLYLELNRSNKFLQDQITAVVTQIHTGVKSAAIIGFSCDRDEAKNSLKEAQKQCRVTEVIRAFVEQGRPDEFFETIDEEDLDFTLEELKDKSRHMIVYEDILCRMRPDSTKVQIVVPKELRRELMKQAHESTLPNVHAGHHGLYMHRDLMRFYFWDSMKQDCVDYAKECSVCQRNKKDHRAPAGLLQSTVVQRPGSVLSMDWLPLPQTKDNEGQRHSGVFLVVDVFSGFIFHKFIQSESQQPSFKQALNAFLEMSEIMTLRESLEQNGNTLFQFSAFLKPGRYFRKHR